jgi:hypothetical protein
VSKITTVKELGIKRMNLNVPIELHNTFKSTTAAQGREMTSVLLDFIRGYVDKHSPSAKKPKRKRA